MQNPCLMRARIAALALMVLVAPSWAADQALSDCMSTDSDHRIIGCTALMKMAARLKPSGLAVVYDNRGSAYYSKGQNDRAIADDNKALQLNPAYPVAYGNRGIAYEAKGEHDRAIADFDKAVALKPDFALAYMNRGIALEAKGEHDRAIGDHTKAIQLQPALADAYANRGLAYEAKGEDDHAIADFSKAIEIRPDFGGAYVNRGAVYGTKGDHDRAIADLTRAIALNPTYAEAYIDRGRDYEVKGDHDRAVADLNKAIELNPTHAEAYVNRAAAYDGQGDHKRALDDLNKAIELNPTSAIAYHNRGETDEAEGEYNHAIADLSRAVELNPVFASAYGKRGKAYEATGDLVHALADFRKVRDLVPADRDAVASIERIEHIINANQHPTAATSSPEASVQAVSRGDKRVALLFGNSDYVNVAALPNPKRDAESIAAALRDEGFEVTVVIDATKAQMTASLRKFEGDADRSDWALVYFAGHGLEMGGRNYLVPVDAQLASDREIDDEAVTLDRVESAVAGAGKLRLVLLDACRNNPFIAHMHRTASLSRSVERGLKSVEPDAGTMVVFATRAEDTADDGNSDHSPFAAAFLKEVRTPGLEVRRLFDSVRDDVLDVTGRHQMPFTYGSLSSHLDFYFLPPT